MLQLDSCMELIWEIEKPGVTKNTGAFSLGKAHQPTVLSISSRRRKALILYITKKEEYGQMHRCAKIDFCRRESMGCLI